MKLTLSLPILLIFSLIAALSALHPKTSQTTVQGLPNERGPVRMIRFAISDDGLYPRRITVDRGLVNIALEDKAGVSEGLVIESVLGDQRTRVAQVQLDRAQRRAHTVIRIPPGTYRVFDASQPSRTAELIVNP